MTADAFEPDALREIHEAREVTVETSRGPGHPTHATIIWIVVVGADRVLVRSVRGPRGRWYRQLLVNPRGTLVVGQRRLAVRAVPADDPERVAACSRALEQKYRSSRASLAAMLREEVLPATLELHPE